MGKVTIMAGVCGFETHVAAECNGDRCQLSIDSQCGNIKKLAEQLTSVDPWREISLQGQGPEVLAAAAATCPHAACPVPAGIIKAIEVAAGLALPKDATITVRRE
jgi:hypothetical protein